MNCDLFDFGMGRILKEGLLDSSAGRLQSNCLNQNRSYAVRDFILSIRREGIFAGMLGWLARQSWLLGEWSELLWAWYRFLIFIGKVGAAVDFIQSLDNHRESVSETLTSDVIP